MSFLTPLFLLGAAAVVAPILFHLIRRTTRERTRFSSLMFLKPTLPRLTKRSRLENLLLLLLRCAVLCLLAAAFARPFLKSLTPEVQAAAETKRTVVLLDASAEGSYEKGSVQALEGRCWTAPTLSRGRLYLRNHTEMVVYDVQG